MLEYVGELMRVAVKFCVHCKEEMPLAIQVHPHLTSTVDWPTKIEAVNRSRYLCGSVDSAQ